MSVLSVTVQQQVVDKLVEDKVLTKAAVKILEDQAKETKAPLFGTLVNSGQVTNEQLTKAIAQATKVPYVNLSEAKVDTAILELLPQEVAERYMAVPLGEIQHRLVVAMLDADNVQAVDFLSNKVGRPLKVYSASEEGIRNVLRQYASNLTDQVVDQMNSMDEASDPKKAAKPEKEGTGLNRSIGGPKAETIKTIVQDSPISKALTTILEYAAKNRASDIHIEPLKESLQIRCRIDGILREIMRLPKVTEPPLISRIKILSSLKIDEHRIPQDGEFTFTMGGKDIDLRISISPVIWGEQVVIRLLDKSGTSLHLEDMGYVGRSLRTLKAGLERTNGMVLTSGPTGSGKSTSLYALLTEVKSESVNIVTLEDPVEYKMEGINQIQVNAEVGLTFASGLRSILRQDPDVVMVGEIRDTETAKLGVEASLTGHLVFSTLHTNSAAAIATRFMDMGIEPFLIASTLHTVIGQRLMRRIGKEKETYQSNAAETALIQEAIGHLLPKTKEEMPEVAKDLGYESLPLATDTAYTLVKGKDTPEQPGGYKGRMGAYEVFDISEKVQELILKRSTSSEIQAQAESEGMVTMRQDGFLKALAGHTTINEVNRVASANSA